jgi:hypothetical protein
MNEGMRRGVTIVAGLVQERADLVNEARPRRLMREDQVIIALERHEAGAGDSAGQHQPVLKWHASVPTTVQHEGWNRDARQQLRHVDVAQDVQ